MPAMKSLLLPSLLVIGGIAIGVGVLVVLETGWFERANMVANSRLSSVVLVLAIMILSLFMAFFYRRFRWEMMEQRYQELKAAQKRLEKESQSSHNV